MSEHIDFIACSSDVRQFGTCTFRFEKPKMLRFPVEIYWNLIDFHELSAYFYIFA